MSEQSAEETLVSFFGSKAWSDLMSHLRRGDEVFHAHLYAETSIHPQSLANAIEKYFQRVELPLQRSIRLYPEPPGGAANLYGIHPLGSAYLEVIVTFRPDVGIVPSQHGSNPEIWDREYMNRYYSGFAFRKLGDRERTAADEYFHSGYWSYVYDFISNPEHLHGHANVKMSLHPVDVMRVAREAIEARGLRVTKQVSIVYNYKGKQQPKIVFLIERPNAFIELEWEFESGTIIETDPDPFGFVLTSEMLRIDLSRVNYLQPLNEHRVAKVIDRVASGLKR